MITNHGIHQWNIIPGLPDTGGQNVFVNQFTDSLANEGYKITVVNRGGYLHPVSQELHSGLVYKDENRRILYIEDNTKEFIRKEDMNPQIETLTANLYDFISHEECEINMIISHYWDGAKIAALLNRKLDNPVKHIWVPHSTGALKKHNVKPERYKTLRIDERIAAEKEIIKEVDYIAYTSYAVKDSLNSDYNYHGGVFLPPGIETDRFYPKVVADDDEIWNFLSGISGLEAGQIKNCKIITEISRTDTTKRKNVLIEAFAKVHAKNPDTFLIIAIDDTEQKLAPELKNLIKTLGIEKYVAPIGNEWERMPTLYRLSSVYCSPSIMEGFGMSVQEAAASKIPVVTSALVPFATEFLAGDSPRKEVYSGDGATGSITAGAGCIIVKPDETEGFAHAISLIINDETLERRMGEQAYSICIPYFTWKSMIKVFLKDIDCSYWKKRAKSIAS